MMFPASGSLMFQIDGVQYLMLTTNQYYDSKILPIVKLLPNTEATKCSEFDSRRYTSTKYSCGNNERVMELPNLGRAIASTHFTIGSRHFIAVASMHSKNDYTLQLPIYEFNRLKIITPPTLNGRFGIDPPFDSRGTSSEIVIDNEKIGDFELFQSLTSYHAKCIESLKIGNDVFLILGQSDAVDKDGVYRNHQTQIFKYCELENKFLPHQLLQFEGQTYKQKILSTFVDKEDYFIAESSEQADQAAILYKYNKDSDTFVLFQKIEGPNNKGFEKVVAFHIDGVEYIACLIVCGNS